MSDAVIWVNGLTGSDANDGLSPNSQKRSFAAAMQAARVAALAGYSNIDVKFYGNNVLQYFCAATEYWGNAYNVSGRVTLSSYGDGKARISGGIKKTGFVQGPSQGLYVAPCLERPRTVHSGARRKMVRASLGADNDFYRINSWATPSQSVLINTALAPSPAAILAGLEMVILMGWSKSFLRVQSAADAGGGLTRVFFEVPERDVEFAKGDLSAPGLNSSFAFGPFHIDGDRFWFENAREYANVQGSWHCDGSTIQVGLPPGCNSVEQLEAEGVYVGGISTCLNFYGASMANPVRNIVLRDLIFEYFDWQVPNTQGYVGYGGGLSLYDNSGTLGFLNTPAAVNVQLIDGFLSEGCEYRDLGTVGIRGLGFRNMRLEGNAFANVAASAWRIDAYNPPESILGIKLNEVDDGLYHHNNVIVDCSVVYTGAAAFAGNFSSFSCESNDFVRLPSIGLNVGNGGRGNATWVGKASIGLNLFQETMQVTADGGAAYFNTNMSGRSKPAPVQSQNAAIDVWCNHFLNHYKAVYHSHTQDYAPCVYGDLETSDMWVRHNIIENASLAFQENCSLFNLFENNVLINVGRERRSAYSGYNIFDPVTGLNTLYQPPLSKPPTVDDNNKMFGLGPYAGAAFQVRQPFLIADDVIDVSGEYNTLSTFRNNGPNVEPSPLHMGAPKAIREKYSQYIKERFVS
jgi:hypothetical protein